MKLLYNLISTAPPVSGIGRYTIQLLEGMMDHSAIKTIKYFDYKNVLDQKKGFSLSDGENPMVKLLRRIATSPIIAPYALSFLHYRTAKNIQLFKDFIYHETNYILMPFSGRTIATIHDLSYIHHAHLHPKDRRQYFEKEMPKTLETANHFIADSQFTKEEMVKILGVDDRRITVVPLGISEQFKPRNRSHILPVLKKHGLTENRYILLVGSIEPRKNIKNFMDAYRHLPESLKKHFMIVHVGPSGWLNSEIHTTVEALERKGQFRGLGYLSEHDLVSVYAGAYVFAFPSIYEGFGLPPLEAMASGVPVLASNTAAIPEVVGDCGVLTSPFDVDKMSSDLARILTDDRLRMALRKNGLEQAKKFTWGHCIDKTVDVYLHVWSL